MGICRRWRRSSSSSSINAMCMFMVFFANGVSGTATAADDTADDAGLLDKDLALLHCPIRLMCLLGTVDGASSAAAAAVNPYVQFGNRLEAVVGRLRVMAAVAVSEKGSSAAAANAASALLAAYDHGTAAAECVGRGDECPLEDYFLLEAQSVRGGEARTVRRRRRGRRKREVRGSPNPGRGSGATKETAEEAGGQRLLPNWGRSMAVHGAVERRRSPNRRAWLNTYGFWDAYNPAIRRPFHHLTHVGYYPSPSVREVFSRDFWKRTLNHPFLTPKGAEKRFVCQRCEAKRSVCFVVQTTNSALCWSLTYSAAPYGSGALCGLLTMPISVDCRLHSFVNCFQNDCGYWNWSALGINGNSQGKLD